MIELRQLTKRFGASIAVDDLSLDIRAGEFLTLLGPSGCGKTTLLRMISGFESPDRGSVHLDGRDVTAVPPYRRDVNQVFQSYALFPHLSVRGNIAFGLKLRGMSGRAVAEKVAEIVETVSLTGMEDRMPDQLSGGQRQRVALARALVCRPKVLLLDEPLAALDAKLRRSMQVELKRLQTRLGITFVFVTHDQEEAMTMSDRIAVMNRGRIEQLDSPSVLYLRPATPFAATFLGQTNLLPAQIVSRTGTETVARLSDGTEIACSLEDASCLDAVFSIRPEHVELATSSVPGQMGFGVRVHEHIFKGSFEQLTVRTAGGLELLVVRPVSEITPKIGSAFYCRLRRDKLVPLNPR